MKTIYIIPAKISNTGSIYDIADIDDRRIIFAKDCLYAVVLSSYYAGKGYTTHKTAAAAIAKSKKLSRDGYFNCIIDTNGSICAINEDYWEDRLVILDY